MRKKRKIKKFFFNRILTLDIMSLFETLVEGKNFDSYQAVLKIIK